MRANRRDIDGHGSTLGFVTVSCGCSCRQVGRAGSALIIACIKHIVQHMYMYVYVFAAAAGSWWCGSNWWSLAVVGMQRMSI